MSHIASTNSIAVSAATINPDHSDLPASLAEGCGWAWTHSMIDASDVVAPVFARPPFVAHSEVARLRRSERNHHASRAHYS
jgi:hypothetical protein